MLLRVVSELFDERHNPLSAQLGSHFETPRSWAAAIAEHRAVLDAISRQSARGARAAMARHLTHSHDRFTANWPAEADTVKLPASARRRSVAPVARRAP